MELTECVTSTGITFSQAQPSEWQMRVGDIIYHPTKGNEPNWFHRWMQRIAFGFKWERKDT